MQSSTHNDLICFSHLRWDFVFQRPQHLMKRFARDRRVFYIEEPIEQESFESTLQLSICPVTGVNVVTPLVSGRDKDRGIEVQRSLLKIFCDQQRITSPTLWLYTPMALRITETLFTPQLMIYDCMDELSMFAGASEELPAMERKLIDQCDLVFTGGRALCDLKRNLRSDVICFPSGVDLQHFAQARLKGPDPLAQAEIPHPRFGFAGVIDERMDLDLLNGIATTRPDWHFVMIGPIAKINPGALPRLPNIHWLGKREYSDLPAYFAHWDIAFMPFALNDATRFISPTKTPEFLAAGLPVISTPITDVVRPYGEMGMAGIARTVAEFIEIGESCLSSSGSLMQTQEIDAFLETQSWDAIWERMSRLIEQVASKEARVA
jgi:UDP-galactopyranose mutase